VKGYAHAIFSGFPTVVLSSIIGDIIEKFPGLEGLFHVASAAISKYDLLCMIRDRFDLNIEVEESDEIRIDRSLDSTLFRQRTNVVPPDWNQMIQYLFEDKTPYELLLEKKLQTNN
jgi:dTDP-4-dehydrorhamnose reductase